MGEIERFGTGVKRVCDMFIDYGLPKPEWLLTADGLVVKVFATPSTENGTLNDENGILNDENGTLNGTLNDENGTLNGQLNSALTETLKAKPKLILDYITLNQGVNAQCILNELNIPRDTFNKIIRQLIDLNLIERRGSKKTGGYYLK